MKLKKFSPKIFIALFILLIHFIPFYILISVSFKRQMDLSSRWQFPNYIYWENFIIAMVKGDLIRALGNTLFITVASVSLIVIFGSMAAYPLARVASSFNRFVLAFILAVMMIPPLSVLVPLYKTMILLKGINSYWGIVLISVTYDLPIAIFLYSNFISTIPKELDEAAMIDGCSRLEAFYRIILPSLKPVTASVIILTGVYIWNDYSFQLYILQRKNMRTVTLAIASFFTENAANLNAGAAASLLVIIPPILLYLAMQKYFVKGITDGAVKG
ncbi:carbohydrate ABC transporter permease [Lacrimispora sp.]|uniref:carbohydrate ABC transporter permease n=1 Tax=Lacrimispora sp. TaxID=2719234 RepID=UPI0028A72E40|nr:carbohydrate ABC transporter permease [Lacrimispora sp.]